MSLSDLMGISVSGGWDAVDNITNNVGQGSGYLSNFFPTSQRVTVSHLDLAPAGNSGLLYRPVASDAPSVMQTMVYAAQDWLNSPYQNTLATTVKGTTSLDKFVAGTQPAQPSLADVIGQVGKTVSGVLGEAGKVKTMAEQLAKDWGLTPRETVQGTPKAGAKEGTNDVNYNKNTTMGADVFSALSSAGQGIISQVKGLFGLGYPATQSQGVSPISGGTSWLVLGGLAIVILMLGRKK